MRSCCRAPRSSASTCATLGLPSLIVPDGAIDGQSAVAQADLVVSAGGSMNREAVALGTPVYTTYGGRLGGVDEMLIREGRLRPLTDPRAIELVKQPERRPTQRRDPELLVDLMLGDRGVTTGRSPPSGRAADRERSAAHRGARGQPVARRSATRARDHPFERRPVDAVLRGFDIVIAGAPGRALRPVMLLMALAILADLRAADPLPRRRASAAPAGSSTCTSCARCARDAEERIGPSRTTELDKLTESEMTRRRARAARDAARRAAAAVERPARRHVDRRPAADPARLLRGADATRSRSTGSGWSCGPG